MEPTSTSPRRGHIPWWRLLVTVSFLTFWNPPATAQLTIEPVPFNATVGEDVLLIAHSVPENLAAYYWYKGRDTDSNNRIATYIIISSQTVMSGPASGRETIFPNGSLLIQNVTQEDTGFYTLQTLDLQLQTQEASAEFRVYLSLLNGNQLTIESVPFNATVGEGVLLLVHNMPENLLGYFWYKGTRTNSNNRITTYIIATQTIISGPASSGREIIYPNGSLLIQNVTQEDTGFYTLQTVDLQLQTQEASAEFRVSPDLRKPFITSNNSDPVEGEDSVALTCESETQYSAYLWWKNGQILLHGDRLELSENNRTLTILHVTRNDTGLYECEGQNAVSASRSDPLTLNVLYGPDTPIILPPESYFHPRSSLSLTCQADSNPPAQFSWLINGKFLQSTQELIIPQITASHTGFYTCLVHNSATGVGRIAVKSVSVADLVTQPSIGATNTNINEGDSVVLTCFSGDTGIFIEWFFNDQSLQLTERMKLSEDHKTLTIDPVEREDAGEYQCEVSNPVSSSKSDPLRLDVNYDSFTTPPGS